MAANGTTLAMVALLPLHKLTVPSVEYVFLRNFTAFRNLYLLSVTSEVLESSY